MKTVKKNNSIVRRRTIRTRLKVKSGSHPRLSVFRSLNHIYAQIIDDSKGVTVAAASSKEIKPVKGDSKTKVAIAVGKSIAERALAAGVKEVVFDRGRYRYHGRIAALANSARESGLKF